MKKMNVFPFYILMPRLPFVVQVCISLRVILSVVYLPFSVTKRVYMSLVIIKQ
ncbi:hypothetical protein Hanom_Chr01g00032821 [Helianthus anomalus]